MRRPVHSDDPKRLAVLKANRLSAQKSYSKRKKLEAQVGECGALIEIIMWLLKAIYSLNHESRSAIVTGILGASLRASCKNKKYHEYLKFLSKKEEFKDFQTQISNIGCIIENGSFGNLSVYSTKNLEGIYSNISDHRSDTSMSSQFIIDMPSIGNNSENCGTKTSENSFFRNTIENLSNQSCFQADSFNSIKYKIDGLSNSNQFSFKPEKKEISFIPSQHGIDSSLLNLFSDEKSHFQTHNHVFHEQHLNSPLNLNLDTQNMIPSPTRSRQDILNGMSTPIKNESVHHECNLLAQSFILENDQPNFCVEKPINTDDRSFITCGSSDYHTKSPKESIHDNFSPMKFIPYRLNFQCSSHFLTKNNNGYSNQKKNISSSVLDMEGRSVKTMCDSSSGDHFFPFHNQNGNFHNITAVSQENTQEITQKNTNSPRSFSQSSSLDHPHHGEMLFIG